VPRSQRPDRTPDDTAGKRGARPAPGAAAKPAAAGGTPAKAAAGRPATGKAAASRGAAGKGGSDRGASGRGTPDRGASDRSARPAGQGRPGPRGRHRLSATERAAIKHRKRTRVLVATVVAVFVAGAVGGLVAQRNVSKNALRRSMNVQTLADQGRTHLSAGGKFSKYNSTPPTSGPHDPNPAPCGISSQAIPNEVQVHDLEHGVIMLQYRPGLDRGQVKTLEDLGRSYSSHVIVAPYPGLNTPVAATAWTKLMALDRVDTRKLRAFIDLYRQRGPEIGIPCPRA
jgi:hypothetical protein